MIQTMGIPGTSEQEEMSSALSDNHSPVSAEEIQQKKQLKLEHQDNNANNKMGETAAHSPVKSNNGKTQNGSVKVNGTTPSNHLSSPPSSGGSTRKMTPADVSSEDIDVTTNDEQKPFPSPQKPESNLRERLRRVRAQVINALIKHPKSQAFRQPVNPKALGIYPIYNQIVKRPMDLGTIKKKIDALDYRTRQECYDDIQQVWNNAKLFNAPGHFVHEAALVMETVTSDKIATFEKDEAEGLFDLPKPPKKVLDVPPREAPRPERRTTQRKISLDYLPGESVQPQQLKKKYVENLSDQLKTCDSILKELIAGKRPYVEPFLNSRKYDNGSYESMNIYKIQQRLQNGYYRHPLQFGNDFRKMVSETYRFCKESDPIHSQAGELQHNFELLFCRVEFEPPTNPASYDVSSEDDAFHNHLLSVQAEVMHIQHNLGDLIRDLIKLRSQEGTLKRRPAAAATARTNNKGLNNPRKRGRSSSASGPSPKKALASSKSPLTPEESIALRAEVAELNEDQQQTIVQIMVANDETLSTDANGYTEIDLGNCSAKTVKQIQNYIKQVKQSPGKPPAKRQRASPSKAAAKASKANLTDSSSESSDDSSSGSSSSSESDSD